MYFDNSVTATKLVNQSTSLLLSDLRTELLRLRDPLLHVQINRGTGKATISLDGAKVFRGKRSRRSSTDLLGKDVAHEAVLEISERIMWLTEFDFIIANIVSL